MQLQPPQSPETGRIGQGPSPIILESDRAAIKDKELRVPGHDSLVAAWTPTPPWATLLSFFPSVTCQAGSRLWQILW